MTQSYRLKTIQAEQFLVDVTPWPAGVTETTAPAGHQFQAGADLPVPILPGDYIVATIAGPVVTRKAEFEGRYELVI